MRPVFAAGCLILISALLLCGCSGNQANPPSLQGSTQGRGSSILLPPPRHESQTSIEEALQTRRSVREYAGDPLTLEEAGQLLWAAQGITAPGGLRTAPSAGALYPLKVYMVVQRIDGLLPGVYRYLPEGHELHLLSEGQFSDHLSAAALRQTAVKNAPAVIVFTAVPERTTSRYGDRGIQYIFMEAGHAAQNVCLQAVALGLGTVTIGAFDDDGVRDTLDLAEEEVPLYLLPVGRLTAQNS